MPESTRDARGHLWPNEAQRALLTSALAQSDRALAAFARWRELVDVESMFGRGSLRLLPLAYNNLTALGCDDPLLARMKGVYRRSWYSVNQLFHDVRPAVETLMSGGIDVTLLKGAPLAIDYYDNVGCRPMSDIDIFVYPHQARESIRLLVSTGWTRQPDLSGEPMFAHAAGFRSAGGATIDLHWFATHARMSEAANRSFTIAREPCDFQGLTVSQLGPTESLALAIVHGLKWNDETPVRWIADSALIVRVRRADIDWDRLIGLGEQHSLGRQLSPGLAYLDREFNVGIPRHVLDAFEFRRRSLVEQIESVVSPLTNQPSPPMPGAVGNHLRTWCRTVDPTEPFSLVAGARRYAGTRMNAFRSKEGGIRRGVVRRFRRKARQLLTGSPPRVQPTRA